LDYIDRFLSLEKFKDSWKDLKRVQTQLEEFNPAHKTCPICGGVMFDLTDLINLSVNVGGIEINPMLQDRDMDNLMIPNQWECAKCGALDILKPAVKSKLVGNDLFGSALQAFNPTVEEIHPVDDEVQPGWFLRIEAEWFFLLGYEKRAKDAIGMK
jgi:hypothetical protein